MQPHPARGALAFSGIISGAVRTEAWPSIILTIVTQAAPCSRRGIAAAHGFPNECFRIRVQTADNVLLAIIQQRVANFIAGLTNARRLRAAGVACRGCRTCHVRKNDGDKKNQERKSVPHGDSHWCEVNVAIMLTEHAANLKRILAGGFKVQTPVSTHIRLLYG